MKKKIIIGIIITVIISLTAFGTIYAYQKETSKLENNTIHGKYNLDRYSEDHSEDCDEHALHSEEGRLISEERNRNNVRLREENSPEYECGEENQHHYRYENQYSEEEHIDCEEGRQFKNQNDNSRSRKENK